MYADAMAATGMSYDSLNHCKQLASRFQFSRRRLNLSWSHTQQEVADSVGMSRKPVEDSFAHFGNFSELSKTQQNAANHAEQHPENHTILAPPPFSFIHRTAA